MKKCCICKRKTVTHQVGLKQVCGRSECFDELVKKAQAAGAKKQAATQKQTEKAQRKGDAEKLQMCKSLHKLCTEAQVAVNSFIRALDENHGYLCISCGKAPIEHAGHLIHAGTKWRTSRFRFFHGIIHGQCLQCNHFKGGDEIGYREGLKRRYGAAYLEMIDEYRRLAEHGKIEPLTKEEVIKIKRWHQTAANKIRKSTSLGERTEYGRANGFIPSTGEIIGGGWYD